MAVFDQDDFFRRLKATLPKRWAGAPAYAAPSAPGAGDGGLLYAAVYSIAGGLAFLMTIWAFVRQQTRLATATDEYLDLASTDFFDGRLPRLAGESNAAFSTRLRAAIVAPSGTQNAVMAAIDAYFSQNPDPTLIGIDVFDQQSDPPRAAFYGLGNAQFAIIFYRPNNIANAWFVGRSRLGFNTYAGDHSSFVVSLQSPYPGLAQFIDDAKDWTYQPVFITSVGEPISLQNT